MKIAERTNEIKKYFDELERVEKETKGKPLFYAKSMLLFSIINATISVAEELITIKKLPVPASYNDIFDILADNKIIDSKLCKDMKILIKIRNIIAHEYETMDEKEVERLSKKISAVKDFIRMATKQIE